jgi:hypothetical protein
MHEESCCKRVHYLPVIAVEEYVIYLTELGNDDEDMEGEAAEKELDPLVSTYHR